ncbi:MAG: methyl-accepting chemotaxis protein [Gemmatimonadaceae bacterium]|nr:methyl-accepting chemotaxis protein [Gemmatimonadaceae bacterium]
MRIATRIQLALGGALGAAALLVVGLLVQQHRTSRRVDTVIDEVIGVRRLAQATALRYRAETGEYKNLLLRGADSTELATYRAAHEAATAATRAYGDSLARRAAAVDEETATLARRFLAEHDRLSAAYVASIAAYAFDSTRNGSAADAMTRRQDRPLLALLDSLTAHTNEVSVAMIAEVRAAQRASTWWAAVIGAVVLAAAAVVAVRVAQGVVRPVLALREAAAGMMRGDTTTEVGHTGSDELGELAEAMRGTLGYLRDTAGVADAARRGAVDVTVAPRSDRDTLSHSLAALLTTVRALVDDVRRLGHDARDGTLATRIDLTRYEGEYRVLADALNRAMDALAAPAHEVATVLGQAATRDLAARSTTRFMGDHARTQRALNEALATVSAALGDVAGASGEVAAATEQIAGGSEALAAGASAQAAAAQETLSQLHALADAAAQSAEAASAGRERAARADTRVSAGSAQVASLVEAVEAMRHSSRETTRILRTIDARAGDAGRGFAVVAEEVRALALRAGTAAEQSRALAEDGLRRADAGVEITDAMAREFDAIRTEVRATADVLTDVAQRSETQRAMGLQCRASLERIATVTQETAAQSEEGAAAAQELASIAARLRETVATFRLADPAADAALLAPPRRRAA